MRSKTITRRARRGAVSLMVFMFLFPISVVLILALLMRVTQMDYETERVQARKQARLLAESALAAWQAKVSGTNNAGGLLSLEPIEGRMEKAGRYWTAISRRKDGAFLLEAHGEAPLQRRNVPEEQDGQQDAAPRFHCALHVLVRADDQQGGVVNIIPLDTSRNAVARLAPE